MTIYTTRASMADEVGDGIIIEPAWEDELMVAMPARHELLAHRRVPLDEVLQHPWCWATRQFAKAMPSRSTASCASRTGALIEQYVATFDVMMTFVSAGLALGLAGAAHIASSREPGVVGRPLAGKSPMLTHYLLRRDAEPSQALARFIERVEALRETLSHWPSFTSEDSKP